MAIHIPPPRKWSHKHVVLVTLIGSLAVVAITAVISISLSPAHIVFSIKNPTKIDTKYNFTLVACNQSPRMAVLYGALSAEIWYSETAWVPAMVDRSALTEAGTRQPPRNVANISVSAEYSQSEQQSTPSEPSSGAKGSPPPPTSQTDWSNCTVVVTANVWFKYGGWISTRSYNVMVNCSPMNFGNRTATVKCK